MSPEEMQGQIRSVVDIASYFQELRGVVLALAERITPSHRGYFTPDEEDQVQGLVVSYWQARHALFELLISFHDDEDLQEEDRPKAFLVAFAAALVLVDAARFLREHVDERPVVRDKLNEPQETFGIPEGMYDQVQRSLVSSRNAWHLYHAIQYYEENEATLRQQALNSPLEPVLEIVQRLRARLDVSVSRFAEVKLRTRMAQVASEIARTLFGRALYGLQKWGGIFLADKYVRRGHHPELPEEVAQQLAGCLLPGDVILARKEYAVTNYFLPGYWPHAALYLGDSATLQELGQTLNPQQFPRWRRLLEATQDRQARVLEAMKDGVQIRPLDSPFASDSAAILRPRMPRNQIPMALDRGLAHEGKRYDFDFDFRRSDRLVCTEVVYRALDGLGSVRLPLVIRAGRPTLSGCDLVEMVLADTNFDLVAVYAPGISDGMQTGLAALETFRLAQCGTTDPSPQET
jgi:hypothetical protein